MSQYRVFGDFHLLFNRGKQPILTTNARSTSFYFELEIRITQGWCWRWTTKNFEYSCRDSCRRCDDVGLEVKLSHWGVEEGRPRGKVDIKRAHTMIWGTASEVWCLIVCSTKTGAYMHPHGQSGQPHTSSHQPIVLLLTWRRSLWTKDCCTVSGVKSSQTAWLPLWRWRFWGQGGLNRAPRWCLTILELWLGTTILALHSCAFHPVPELAVWFWSTLIRLFGSPTAIGSNSLGVWDHAFACV